MTEGFKQSRKKITQEELGAGDRPPVNPLDSIRRVQETLAAEQGMKMPQQAQPDAPFDIQGQMPPEFREALARQATSKQMQMEAAGVPTPPSQIRPPSPRNVNVRGDDEAFPLFEAPPDRPRPQPRATPDRMVQSAPGSDQLEHLLKKIAGNYRWEPFEFPSKGKFYTAIPATVDIRQMTGEEEQILGTPRFIKQGTAIDMIFRRCIRQQIHTEDLLSVDRTHLLIFLRGISHTPEYDVSVKCPGCGKDFPYTINIDELDVTLCPDDFGPDNLTGYLPKTGFSYTYRLPTGKDESVISAYREKRISAWGDQGEDDTLLYRTALLLEEIEGVIMKKELALLLRKLPIQDVAHLRNLINTPPFGVDTQIDMECPMCFHTFKIEMPFETSFFFPDRKEEKTQA